MDRKLNRTEIMEQNIAQFNRERYQVARRIIDCRDNLTDLSPCRNCCDRVLCYQIKDVLFS